MPGGVINTSTAPKLLWPGVHAIWGQTYNEHAREVGDLYDELDSNQAYEQEVMLTGFGLGQLKTEGGPVTYDSEIQGFVTTYVHVAWSLGYIVTHEEIKDNLYKKVATNRAKANAFSVNQTIENLGAFLYNNAFSSTYFTTADGQPLISASHVNASGGTFSNALTPAADLCEPALEDICIQMMGATNDRGLRISVLPRSLHVAPAEWYNAHRILKSVLQSNTTSNNVNVLMATNAFPGGVKLNHYFTAPHAWFVRTNIPHGMQLFWRERPEFAQDNDFDTKNEKAATYFRMSFGCTDPRGIYASNGP